MVYPDRYNIKIFPIFLSTGRLYCICAWRSMISRSRKVWVRFLWVSLKGAVLVSLTLIKTPTRELGAGFECYQPYLFLTPLLNVNLGNYLERVHFLGYFTRWSHGLSVSIYSRDKLLSGLQNKKKMTSL